jgi:3-deoxy-D-manno-octulosonic-acid transferase
MSDTFFFFVYRHLLMPIVRSLLLALYLIRAALPEKLRLGLEMRRGQPWLDGAQQTRPIWIHCASGEFEYAKPVIRLIKLRWPNQPVIVTYFSPSYRKQVEQFAGVDQSFPLPIDERSAILDMIRFHKPRVALFARTDVWPEAAKQCRSESIPALLFSATLTENSGRMRGFARWAARATMNQLTMIYCTSRDDQAEFRKLALRTPIEVKGDTRFDQAIARIQNHTRESARSIFNLDKVTKASDRIVVAGSTWFDDEKALLSAWKILKTRAAGQTRLRLILVPHEPTFQHLEQLRDLASINNISLAYYSDWSRSNTDDRSFTHDEVLVVDQVGVLAELYKTADGAFIGGSFRKTVHSVMEPLAAGCVSVVGPYYKNNREAMAFHKEHLSNDWRMVSVAQNADEMASWLQKMADIDSATLQHFQTQIMSKTHENSGASRSVIDWLQEQI